jgi:glycosyltransferase involved in cell wall biosynthesis
MKNNGPLVSIIIPSRDYNSSLVKCFDCIKKQTYKNIETIIIVDKITSQFLTLTNKYKCQIFEFDSKVKKGIFDAPHRRNFGAKKAKGKYLYYIDSDMELTKNVIKEAIDLCSGDCSAAIIPEDSFGIGAWAKAKNLERRCYWGDDTIEAPRFFRKNVWENLGGLDESLGGDGDDWDLYQKLIKKKLKVGRTKSMVMHNEGNLKLGKLIKKRFMYGRDSFKYVLKRPIAGTKSYFPIRKAYLKNWKLFIARPSDTIVFIVMRSLEYIAGFSGILYSIIKK